MHTYQRISLNALSLWCRRKKATKREILSLVGLLQHATKMVKPGCAFIARIYVCHSSQSEEAILLHKTHKGIQIRSPVVAYVFHQMEWC